MSTIQHSVKVPRLYKDASRILKSVHEGGSLKDLIYNHNKFSNIKALHALVAEAVKYNTVLTRILDLTCILQLEDRCDPWLAKVLLTELIFGKKKLPGDSKPVLTILKYKDDIEKHLEAAGVNISSNSRQKKKVKPRYVRINTLKISLEDAVNKFKDEGWEELHCPSTYDEFLQLIQERMFNEEYVFVQDYHVKNLLVFPSTVCFYDHPAYLERYIVLQDKASCLLTCCVSIKPSSFVLDMCAGPGMKTALLAACINNQGKIYAVEFNTRRYITMSNLLKDYGVNCVELRNCDAGSVGPNTCKDVKYILVDPSCSGTGMTSRVEDLEVSVSPEKFWNKLRLKKLANIQGYLLRHAVSNFPTAKYVFYSTCSIQEEENEVVVESVLGCAKLHGFSLLNLKKKISGWKHFGSDNYECGKKCIYTRPENDFTNGGFLAVFKRKSKNVIPAASEIKGLVGCEKLSETKKLKLSEQFFALVNTLKISVEDAIQFFVDNGWKHLPSPMNYNIFLSGLLDETNRVKEKFFEQDFHVKELLLFPLGIVDEISEKFISKRKFILLDKVSCLAVHLLDPVPGSKVLDLCAGMEKMSLCIASRMNNNGTVFAYESDNLLHSSLLRELKKCSISCVDVKHDSGLYSSSSDCPGVKLILVCPPCSGSGSGLLEKTQYSWIKNTANMNKEYSLRKFIVTQFSLLRHAFTEFPEARRIVYITRSVHPEENEDIINALLVLAKFNGFELIDAPSKIDGWSNENSTKYFWGTKCLITRDEESITKGFFIAVFERIFMNKNLKIQNDNSLFIDKEDADSNALSNMEKDRPSTYQNHNSSYCLLDNNKNSNNYQNDNNKNNESWEAGYKKKSFDGDGNKNLVSSDGSERRDAVNNSFEEGDVNMTYKKLKKHKRKNKDKENLMKNDKMSEINDLPKHKDSVCENVNVESYSNRKLKVKSIKRKKTVSYDNLTEKYNLETDKSNVCEEFINETEPQLPEQGGNSDVESGSLRHKKKKKRLNDFNSGEVLLTKPKKSKRNTESTDINKSDIVAGELKEQFVVRPKESDDSFVNDSEKKKKKRKKKDK